MTVHVTATHVETGQEYEAVVEEGSYCIVSHGAHALPDPTDLRCLGRPVTLTPAAATLPATAGPDPSGTVLGAAGETEPTEVAPSGGSVSTRQITTERAR